MDGDTEITYWIDRSAWGRGIAGRALALFLDAVTVRPLYARAAGDNLGSLQVLRKSGFTVTGTEVSYASARNAEIEETVLRLDQALPVPGPAFGADVMREPIDQPFGVRDCAFRDPSGNVLRFTQYRE